MKSIFGLLIVFQIFLNCSSPIWPLHYQSFINCLYLLPSYIFLRVGSFKLVLCWLVSPLVCCTEFFRLSKYPMYVWTLSWGTCDMQLPWFLLFINYLCSRTVFFPASSAVCSQNATVVFSHYLFLQFSKECFKSVLWQF